MQHQLEWLAAVAAARIGLFDRQLRAMQHAQSEHLLRTVLDRPEETDAHLGQILRLGNVSTRTHIDIRDGRNSGRKAWQTSRTGSDPPARPHRAPPPGRAADLADAPRTRMCSCSVLLPVPTNPPLCRRPTAQAAIINHALRIALLLTWPSFPCGTSRSPQSQSAVPAGTDAPEFRSTRAADRVPAL